MIWIILTFVFGWLLCGALAIRMAEKDLEKVENDQWLYYSTAPFALIIMWIIIWPSRLGKFAKGIVAAWKEAKK